MNPAQLGGFLFLLTVGFLYVKISYRKAIWIFHETEFLEKSRYQMEYSRDGE